MKKILIIFFTVLFCLTSSVVWSLEFKDLVYRDGLYYKKFTDIPFTGKVTGKKQGLFENGIKEGLWVYFHENGGFTTPSPKRKFFCCFEILKFDFFIFSFLKFYFK